MKKIVKYDNYMNSLRFANFTHVDMDFFIALCSYMKNQDTNRINLSFHELRDMANYTKSNSIAQFASDLEQMNEKLMRITCRLKTETEVLMFVLFPTFKISLESQLLTLSVNQDFKFILNEITKNFTRFDLHEFVELRSKYSKTLYRLLKQYRSTDHYEVPIDEFKRLMDYSKTYKNKHVMDKVIKPSILELENYFQDLRCEAKYAPRRGNPLSGYIFKFTPERMEESSQKDNKTPGQRISPENQFTNFNQREYYYDMLEKKLLNS